MSALREMQNRLTTWLRSPESAPPPEGVDPGRLAVYRELLLNNVTGFVENGFPVLKAMLPDSVWQELVSDFFAGHRCHSPYFRDIPAEFRQWLEGRTELAGTYPWLPELAHFEWAEMEADMAEGTWRAAEAGELWQLPVVIAPCVWPLVYRWPVHRFPLADPEPSPSPVALLLYRTRDHAVRWLETSLPVLALVEQLQNGPRSLREAVQDLAADSGMDPEVLADMIRPGILALEASGIVQGTAPAGEDGNA